MRKKSEQYEWATVSYEGSRYDVCVGMLVEQIEEIHVLDTSTDITPVMRERVMDWMLEEAIKEISINDASPHFKDMSRRELEIDQAGFVFEEH